MPSRSTPWNHNLQFHRWILDNMPTPCHSALDVGCGDGVLTPKLAARAQHVTAIDVSGAMIAIARQNGAPENVTYVEGDLLTYPLPTERFDFIAAVAVIHHMPLGAVLGRMSALLQNGGVLAVVGLAQNRSLMDHAVSAASVPVARVFRIHKGWWSSPALRIDPDVSYREIKRAASALLPGADLKRRLFFRYTLLWRKPRVA
jgi:2-polyprenyl-3-methyl-5-hydroxy-6-metoxy-1,4-benzoquinol methylase